MFAPEQMISIFDAIAFSAEKHKKQKRKDLDETPYINHPVDVLRNIIFLLVDDTTELYLPAMIAILHDTVEDTNTTYEEIETRYGKDVADGVMEVTNNKELKGEESKTFELEKAKTLSLFASMVRISDKISNVKDIDKTKPKSWDLERKLKYIKWAKALVDNILHTDSLAILQLKYEFHKRYFEALSRLG